MFKVDSLSGCTRATVPSRSYKSPSHTKSPSHKSHKSQSLHNETHTQTLQFELTRQRCSQRRHRLAQRPKRTALRRRRRQTNDETRRAEPSRSRRRSQRNRGSAKATEALTKSTRRQRRHRLQRQPKQPTHTQRWLTERRRPKLLPPRLPYGNRVCSVRPWRAAVGIWGGRVECVGHDASAGTANQVAWPRLH